MTLLTKLYLTNLLFLAVAMFMENTEETMCFKWWSDMVSWWMRTEVVITLLMIWRWW